MTTVLTIVHALASCNLHLCFHLAFSLYCFHRAWLCAEGHRRDEMQEHVTHGVFYLLLGMI